ncbi:hypothetical protein L596_000368 [Steinernema carpocapsae]|uniref:Uncharacterized protein n=1 Tax=Steinernema carpocapsae TaxID=34508 RepID=A0A4V6I6X6_STECR|nr:hypothetical protein L596_000368 [Steinernema carpocapsae]
MSALHLGWPLAIVTLNNGHFSTFETNLNTPQSTLSSHRSRQRQLFPRHLRPQTPVISSTHRNIGPVGQISGQPHPLPSSRSSKIPTGLPHLSDPQCSLQTRTQTDRSILSLPQQKTRQPDTEQHGHTSTNGHTQTPS